ncbi:hypothetical protein RFI_11329, partial [Reticulomyxa filosa]
KFPYRYVEFTYEMFAKNTSLDCLQDDTCLPVGGYSVWTSFEKVSKKNPNQTSGENAKKGYVFGITSMDTTAMFHQNVCRGSDANQSGLVALLAALSALSGVKEIIYKLSKQIMIGVFQGEAYDFVGSRKFVHDITHPFNCTKWMTSYSDGCWQPFVSSSDFTNIEFNNIGTVIELQQIGIKADSKPRQLFAHYERNVSSTTNLTTQALIANISRIAAQVANESNQQFVVSPANDPSLPGTPPSSFWSFLQANTNITGVVLTDFQTNYSNQWFHSVFDSIYQIDADQVCMTATLFARTLLTAADTDGLLNDSFLQKNVNADCILVETLINCLMEDMTCNLVASIAPSATDPTPSHYTSVYQIVEDQSIIGTPQFVFRYLANLTRIGGLHGSCSEQNDCFGQHQVCAGTYDGSFCVNSSTYYHAAVDPQLTFNYDSQLFEVPNISNFTGLLWTESTWPSKIGTRFYVKESDDAVTTMIVCGSVAFVLSLAVTWKLQSYCQTRFKKPSTTVLCFVASFALLIIGTQSYLKWFAHQLFFRLFLFKNTTLLLRFATTKKKIVVSVLTWDFVNMFGSIQIKINQVCPFFHAYFQKVLPSNLLLFQVKKNCKKRDWTYGLLYAIKITLLHLKK